MDNNDNYFTNFKTIVSTYIPFLYENFAYVAGTVVVIMGIIVYINMKKISLYPQLSKSKTLIVEGMNDAASNDAANNDDNTNDNISSGDNSLLTDRIDLDTKLKSGFCKMHASKHNSATDLDNECGAFTKTSCLKTDCCGWADLASGAGTGTGTGKCRSGNSNGITFKYDGEKKIDIDCYYYKGNEGLGPNCGTATSAN